MYACCFAHRQFLLKDNEREVFVGMMRMYEEFCGAVTVPGWFNSFPLRRVEDLFGYYKTSTMPSLSIVVIGGVC